MDVWTIKDCQIDAYIGLLWLAEKGDRRALKTITRLQTLANKAVRLYIGRAHK